LAGLANFGAAWLCSFRLAVRIGLMPPGRRCSLRDNPAALAEWEQLRRVRKVVPVTPADAEPESPDAPADVPVALPATAATTPAEQQKAA